MKNGNAPSDRDSSTHVWTKTAEEILESIATLLRTDQ